MTNHYVDQTKSVEETTATQIEAQQVAASPTATSQLVNIWLEKVRNTDAAVATDALRDWREASNTRDKIRSEAESISGQLALNTETVRTAAESAAQQRTFERDFLRAQLENQAAAARSAAKRESYSDRVRSIVLLAIVLAIVVTPHLSQCGAI